MIYLPNHTALWWTWDESQPLDKVHYSRGIGFYSHAVIQADFATMVERHHTFFLGALRMGWSMEAFIYELLGYRDMSIADLKYACPEIEPHWGIRSDCTVQTALNRLMKQGKVKRTLHARGWYQWYVYERID